VAKSLGDNVLLVDDTDPDDVTARSASGWRITPLHALRC
jgi:hypothetical protein